MKILINLFLLFFLLLKSEVICVENTKNLNKEYKILKDKINKQEAVTLFDSKSFLIFELQQSIAKKSNPIMIQNLEKMHQTLKEYYSNTHQLGGFEELEIVARQSFFISLMDDPDLLKSLHKRACRGNKNLQITKYVELCLAFINDIKQKNKEQPSIHGHPRDLFNSQDIKILTTLKSKRFYPAQLKETNYSVISKKILKEVNSAMQLIEAKLEEANQDLGNYASLFKAISSLNIQNLNAAHLSQNQLRLILEAKAALMNIQLKTGRYFEMTALIMAPQIDSNYRKGLQNLLKIDQLRHPSIDLALLESLKEEHDRAAFHPKVAIEGGGPTGLLTAITQFQAGADVTLFEKRSTFYDRTQIVRLDPHWMSMLKFYLGEEYYKLFIDGFHRGILRPDGFGEIATAFLEEALHNQLTKLISILPHNKNVIPPIERLAAYEMKKVIPPQPEGGNFQIMANYLKESDPIFIINPHSNTNENSIPKTIMRDVEILICAGGKSSPMKEQFLPSSIAVTEKQYYGVSSWLANPLNRNEQTIGFSGQNPDVQDLFQDFRGMIHLDKDFRLTYLGMILEGDFDYLDEELKIAFLDFINSNPTLIDFISKGPSQAFVQTRTFENFGLIYVGMEVPSELKEIIEALTKELTQAVDQAPDKDKESFNRQKDFLIKNFQHCWFQTVSARYGLDQSLGLTIDKLDKKFSAMFSVEQNRLHHDHFFSQITRGPSHLFVAAAGDSNNSPHFMRYSGLTGAREDILGLQKWTKAQALKINSGEQTYLLQQLIEDWERTAKFVISRGHAFLKPLSESLIAQQREKKIINLLEKQVDETQSQTLDYQVIKTDKEFFISFEGVFENILPQKDGSLQMGGKNYESFEQIRLEVV